MNSPRLHFVFLALPMLLAPSHAGAATITLLGKDFPLLSDWVVQSEFHEKVLYPFEFLVPVSNDRQPLRFKLELTLPDGKTSLPPEATVQLEGR